MISNQDFGHIITVAFEVVHNTKRSKSMGSITLHKEM